jgi:hypothetical protein
MAEVVTAFQKIAAEGKRAAKETEGAFAELNNQFKEVGRNLLAGLSIVYAADKLKELFKQTLENADALVRLQRQTGLSTDAIQAFGRAAIENGVNTETANQALARFTTSIGKAQTGSRNSQLALRELGTSFKDLQALSPDQRLQFVANALANIPDPGRRARIEVELFSKSGTELDQTLVHLGREGIGAFIAKLQELGTYLDSDSINRLQHLGDNIRDIKTVAQGLGSQLLVGLAPSLEKITGELTKSTGAGEGFRLVGVAIGAVFRAVVLVMDTAGKTIGLNWALIMNHIQGTAAAAALQVRGHFILAAKEIVDTFKRDKTIISEYLADLGAARRNLFGDDKPPPKEPEAPGGGGAGAPDEALAQARYQLLVTRLDNELKLFEAHNQLVLAQDKAAYEKREISLQEYFDRRAAAINADFDKRIATAKAKLAAEEALPLKTGVSEEAAAEEKRVQVEKLRGEIADLNGQREVALQQDKNALHQEEQRQSDAAIKAQETLLTLAGRRADAERLRLKLAADALDKELAAGGVAPAERQAAVTNFTQQGGAKIDFDEASRDAQAKLLQLDTQKKAIQDQINAGQIFNLDGQQRILELERAQLPALEADAKAMQDLAEKTKDPNIQAQAAAFNEKLQEIKVSTDQNAAAMKEYRAGIESAVGGALNTFLDEAIFKSKSLGAAFSNAIRQMITDLAKLALKIEEEQFLKWIFSGFGAGGGGKGGGGLFSDLGLGGGAGVNAASGGYIRGPGSTTSDSIPAWLSDREFVVNAGATQRPGVLQFLEALNRGPVGPDSVGRFSVGSRYAGAARAAAASAPAPAPIAFHIEPAALNMTLRDWFEREIADIHAKR